MTIATAVLVEKNIQIYFWWFVITWGDGTAKRYGRGVNIKQFETKYNEYVFMGYRDEMRRVIITKY